MLRGLIATNLYSRRLQKKVKQNKTKFFGREARRISSPDHVLFRIRGSSEETVVVELPQREEGDIMIPAQLNGNSR